MKSCESSTYRFSFHDELVGNPSDFNEVIQEHISNFRLVNWFHYDITLEPTYACTFRKSQKEGEFRLRLSNKKHFEQQMSAQNNKVRVENFKLLDSNIEKVLELINGKFKHYFEDFSGQFIQVEELALENYQKQQKYKRIDVNQHKYLKGQHFFSILLRQPFKKLSCLKNYQITNLIIDPTLGECYPIKVNIKSGLEDIYEGLRKHYFYDYQSSFTKVLQINYEVNDEKNFFRERGKFDQVFDSKYQEYNQLFSVKKIKFPYRQDRNKRRKNIEEKHYSLAFQGGGAKGLAYVGAYKALMENTKIMNNQKKKVPISSIIGSSAGGMIAMAVSTGISSRWMQKICYCMMDIPQKDRIMPQDTKKDNIEKTTEDIYEAIKDIFHQYGILHKESYGRLKELIQKNLPKIQKELVKMVSNINPSFGQIFKTDEGCLNFEGLIVHGALLKGEAVHDIGAECLIRYFLKQFYQHKTEPYRAFLDDCFSAHRTSITGKSEIKNSMADNVITCLESYHKICRQILNTPIKVIKKKYENSCEMFTSILNDLILLITQKEEEEESIRDLEDYKYIDEDVVKTFKWSILQELFELKPLSELNKIIPEKITQKSYDEISSVKDLLKLHYTKPKSNNKSEYVQMLKKQYELRLLSPKLFNVSKKDSEKTIEQFIRELFGETYSKYFDDPKYYNYIPRKYEENDLKISQFQLQLSEILIDSFSRSVEKDKWPQSILEFKKNKDIFRELVSTITMIEYYSINPVQFTCTSVDLDDKILRLFNQKTTPQLPVCKAVQMTGSFPGVFKAQKWKPEWGKYNIFHRRHIVKINLVGHQFTDGGMLANFPIKYLDNAQISKLYFRHTPSAKNTIMLGFGLDSITNYKPNMKQILQKMKKQEVYKEQMSKINVTKQLGINGVVQIISDLLTTFSKDMSDKNQKKINWSDIDHAVLLKFPLLKFGLQILKAYPVADRNFNIQVFQEKVIVQNIYQKWKNQNILAKQEEQSVSRSIIQIKNILDLMKKKRYDPTRDMKQKPLQTYINVEYQAEKIFNLCRKRAEEIKDRLAIKKSLIQYIYTHDFTIVKESDPWFNLKSERELSIQMVRRLIFIFMMLIRQSPRKIKQQLSEQYIKLKYPKSFKSIDNPLQYDVSQNLKRMIHYLYLKINTTKQNAEEIVNKIRVQNYQKFYEEAVQNEEKEDHEVCFNYQNIKNIFRDTIQNMISELKLKTSEQNEDFENRMIKSEWEQKFLDFLQEYVGNKRTSNELYIMQIFKQTLFVKGSDIATANEEQQVLNRKNLNKDTFQNTYSGSSGQFVLKMKSVFLFQTEIIYEQHRDEIDEILMKELCRRPLYYIEEYIKKSDNEEIREFLNDKNKFSFIKLVRALTYYQDDKLEGQDRFTIKERKELQNGILSIFFGIRRKKYMGFQQMIVSLFPFVLKEFNGVKKFIKQTIAPKKFGKEAQKIIECYFLRYLQRNSLSFTIANKINSKQDGGNFQSLLEQQEMSKKYINFIQDFKFVLNCFKDATIILKGIIGNKRMKMKGFEPFDDDSIEYYSNIVKKLDLLLYNIHNEFIQEYTDLSNKPNNTLDISKLEEIFIIKYSYIKETIKEIYSPLKKKMFKLMLNSKQSEKQEQKFLKYVIDIFDRIHFYKPSLPLFNIDWKINLQLQNVLLISKGKLQEFPSRFKKNLRRMIIYQSKGRFIKDKQLNSLDQHTQLHLILEGVSTSNQYFCTYYSVLEEVFSTLMDDSTEKQVQELASEHTSAVSSIHQGLVSYFTQHFEAANKQPKQQHYFNDDLIQAITSSNFHVVFGFLLALKTPYEELRKETYKLKRIANSFQNQNKIQNYFQSFHWAGQNTNQYKELMNYMQSQRVRFFQQFQHLKTHNYINNSLSNDYKDIKLLMKNQTAHFTQIYTRILDQISEEVQFVDGIVKPVLKPKQICKKFAFNYVEELEKRRYHSYAELNKQAFQIYKDFVGIIYGIFGTLIEGILCTIVSDKSSIRITSDNAGLITKGIIVKRLLNTFRIKQYVMEQLEDKHLSPSITLAKFYESAPISILLTFNVINISEQRVEFLNKFRTPYMPVWAAIVASSSLPFLFDYFAAPNEWQGLQSVSTFYEIIVQNFIKERNTTNTQYNEYCSANFLSSFPLELLTNKTVNKKLGDLSKLKQISIAFNDYYQDGFESLKIQKKFFSLKPFAPYFRKKIYNYIKSTFTFKNMWNWVKGNKIQKQDVDYRSYYVQSLMQVANVQNTMSTLVNSSDNFIMQWYRDKLIRLPIKLGTLDFHEIVDQQIFKNYKVQILSEKAKQTIERSYEITKSFTSYITMPEEERRKIQHKILLRLEIVYKQDDNKLVHKFFKLKLMNHSKWNQNKFNNFLVYHRMHHSITDQEYIRDIDSQIQWNIENGAQLDMIFYFPFYPDTEIQKPPSLKQTLSLTNIFSPKRKSLQEEIHNSQLNKEHMAKVLFTHWIFDFSHVIDCLNDFQSSGVTDADIFDFSFDYSKDKLLQNIIHEWASIMPVSVKKMNIFGQNFTVPKLKVKRVKEENQGRNKKKIQTFYIKQLTNEIERTGLLF